jgi:Rieske Fe-S protein
MYRRVRGRRDFLRKALALAGIAAISPALLPDPKKIFAANGEQTLGQFTFDLSKYPALSKVNGSVAITIPGSQYTYPGDVILPFRFILTRSAAETFIAEEGYCTHQQSGLNPFDGTFITCSNPDPGHGSEFNLDGSVARSPARRSLNVYSTSYDAANNTVTLDIPNLAVNPNIAAEYTSELYQNFPNPARSSTTVRFKLGYYSKVRLTISDVLGHIVAVLIDGELPSGEHNFDFDASIWNSGIYFYQLNIEGLVLTREMIVAK